MSRAAAVLVVLGLIVSAPASADWPPNGKVVFERPFIYAATQFCVLLEQPSGDLSLVVCQEGGIGKSWSVQRIMKTGDLSPGWPLSGVNTGSLTKIAAGEKQGFAVDDAGGVWRAWNTSSQTRAFHVSGDGSTQPVSSSSWWTVATSSNGYADAATAPGGDVYVAWGGRLKRITVSGAAASGWAATGLVAFSTTDDSAILSDGAGGVLLFDTSALPRVKRVDANAAYHAGWSAAGLTLGPNSLLSFEDSPVRKLVHSGPDHAIAAWIERSNQGVGRVVLQRFHLDGTLDPAWPVAGFEAVAEDSISRTTIIPDGLGGIHVLWSLHGLPRATHVLASGAFAPGLGSAGVSPLDGAAQYREPIGSNPIDPLMLSYYVADRATNGGLIFAWNDARRSPNDIRVRWLKSDLTPDPSEPDTGRVIATTTPVVNGDGDGVRAALADGSGGLFLAWQGEAGAYPNYLDQIWMTHIIPSALVGVPPTPPAGHAAFALRAPAPTPTRDVLDLRFALPDDAPARIELFDVVGRLQRSLDVRGGGEHTVRLDRLGELAPGLYVVRLARGLEQRTARVVIAR